MPSTLENEGVGERTERTKAGARQEEGTQFIARPRMRRGQEP